MGAGSVGRTAGTRSAMTPAGRQDWWTYQSVIGRERTLPAAFIDAQNYDVTHECRRYIAALIGKAPPEPLLWIEVGKRQNDLAWLWPIELQFWRCCSYAAKPRITARSAISRSPSVYTSSAAAKILRMTDMSNFGCPFVVKQTIGFLLGIGQLGIAEPGNSRALKHGIHQVTDLVGRIPAPTKPCRSQTTWYQAVAYTGSHQTPSA